MTTEAPTLKYHTKITAVQNTDQKGNPATYWHITTPPIQGQGQHPRFGLTKEMATGWKAGDDVVLEVIRGKVIKDPPSAPWHWYWDVVSISRPEGGVAPTGGSTTPVASGNGIPWDYQRPKHPNEQLAIWRSVALQETTRLACALINKDFLPLTDDLARFLGEYTEIMVKILQGPTPPDIVAAVLDDQPLDQPTQQPQGYASIATLRRMDNARMDAKWSIAQCQEHVAKHYRGKDLRKLTEVEAEEFIKFLDSFKEDVLPF